MHSILCFCFVPWLYSVFLDPAPASNFDSWVQLLFGGGGMFGDQQGGHKVESDRDKRLRERREQVMTSRTGPGVLSLEVFFGMHAE